MVENTDAIINIVDASTRNDSSFSDMIAALSQQTKKQILVLENKTINKENLKQQDLMLVSLESWTKLEQSQSVWLKNKPSTLIIKP